MENTCSKCGYQRTFCQCGRKKNTSGDTVKFSQYKDYTHDKDNYAQTAPMYYNKQEKPAMKYFEELMPQNNEPLNVWIDRTEIGSDKLKDYSWEQHIFKTSKGVWACHRTTMHCFICSQMQYIEMLRLMAQSIANTPLSKDLTWYVDELGDGSRTYNIA